jgi:hypothetical protein
MTNARKSSGAAESGRVKNDKFIAMFNGIWPEASFGVR